MTPTATTATSPEAIATRIYNEVELANTPIEHNGEWIVAVPGAQLIVALDEQYADGIMWRIATGNDEDGPHSIGGWSFADTATAEREITQAIETLTTLAA